MHHQNAQILTNGEWTTVRLTIHELVGLRVPRGRAPLDLQETPSAPKHRLQSIHSRLEFPSRVAHHRAACPPGTHLKVPAPRKSDGPAPNAAIPHPCRATSWRVAFLLSAAKAWTKGSLKVGRGGPSRPSNFPIAPSRTPLRVSRCEQGARVLVALLLGNLADFISGRHQFLARFGFSFFLSSSRYHHLTFSPFARWLLHFAQLFPHCGTRSRSLTTHTFPRPFLESLLGSTNLPARCSLRMLLLDPSLPHDARRRPRASLAAYPTFRNPRRTTTLGFTRIHLRCT